MNNVQLSTNQALRPELGVASEILLGLLLLALVFYVKVRLVRNTKDFVIANRKIGFGFGVAGLISIWTWAMAVMMSAPKCRGCEVVNRTRRIPGISPTAASSSERSWRGSRVTKAVAKLACGDTKSSDPMGPGVASQLASPWRALEKVNEAVLSGEAALVLLSATTKRRLSKPTIAAGFGAAGFDTTAVDTFCETICSMFAAKRSPAPF